MVISHDRSASLINPAREGFSVTSKKAGLIRRLKAYLPLYLMLIPGAAYLIINNYIPMTGIVIAFEQFNYAKGMWGSPFIGFKNFEFLFKTKDAWIITRNTLLYNVAFIVLGTLCAIAVAILLNEIHSARAKKLYQTTILVPFLISIVVVSYLVYAFLSSDSGFLNSSVLPLLGIEPISWYTSPQYWPVILIIVNIWKGLGYNCIIYYATLVGIDRGYYEAAVIDGANRWKQIIHITLPALKPTIITLTLMAIGKIFYSDFGLFYQVPRDSNSLYNVSYTLDVFVFKQLKSSTTGMASAAAFVQSVAGCITILTANAIVRKVDRESAMI